MTTPDGGRSRPTALRDHDGSPTWQVLMPPGWTALSTDPAHREPQIRRLVEHAFARTSRDESATVRRELVESLTDQADRAHRHGGTQMFLLTEPVRGVPIAGSLVVSVLDHVDDGSFPPLLEAVLGGSEGVLLTEMVEIGRFGALRRVRRTPGQTSPVPDHESWVTSVDYVVEVSPARLLVLVFVTTTDPVAGPMVALFDAIAGSLTPTPETSSG